MPSRNSNFCPAGQKTPDLDVSYQEEAHPKGLMQKYSKLTTQSQINPKSVTGKDKFTIYIYIYIYIYGKKNFPCDRKVPFWGCFTLPTSIFLPAGPKGVFLCVSRRALSAWWRQNLKIFTNRHKKSIKSVFSGHFRPHGHIYGVYLESPITSKLIQNPSDTLHMHY